MAAVDRRSSRLPLFVALVAVSLATRWLLLVAPPLSDEPVHLIGSWTLLRGGRLYLDFVDNKPPLLYVYYALAQLPFGTGMLAVRLVTLLLCIPLTAFAASAFHRHQRAGVAAALLYLVAGVSFVIDEGQAVNTEVLMLLPAAWAFVVLRGTGGRSIAAACAGGVLLGVAALFKVTAVLWLLAVPCAAWRLAPAGARWRHVNALSAAAAVGAALPILVALALLARQDAAAAAVDWTFLRNFSYISAPIGPGEALRRALAGVLGWSLCTGPLWWAAWRGSRRAPASQEQWLASLLVVLALPSVALGLRFFAHYYLQVLFPLCLAAGPEVAQLARRPLSGPARVAAAWTALALCLSLAGNVWILYGDPLVAERLRASRSVAAWLERDACRPGATAFVWAIAPQLYVESGLPPASRFVLPQDTIAGYVPGRVSSPARPRDAEAALRDQGLLMGDLERHRATYVLDASRANLHRWGPYPLSSFPRLFRYVRERYELAGVVERVDVYRRKGCGRQ